MGIINISVGIESSATPRASFGVPLIADFANIKGSSAGNAIVRTYGDASEMLLDGWDTWDAAYVMAKELCAQQPKVETFKVGGVFSGQALGLSLTDIETADGDWFCLLATSRVKADIEAAAAWTETVSKARRIYVAQTYDAAVLAAGATVMSALHASDYQNTSCWYQGLTAQQVRLTLDSLLEGGDGVTIHCNGKTIGPIAYATSNDATWKKIAQAIVGYGEQTVLGAGTVTPSVAQKRESTLSVGGVGIGAGDVAKVTIGGTLYQYNVLGGATPDDVCAGLAAVVNGGAGDPLYTALGVGGGGGVLRLTAKVGGVAGAVLPVFAYTNAGADTGTWSAVTTTAGVDGTVAQYDIDNIGALGGEVMATYMAQPGDTTLDLFMASLAAAMNATVSGLGASAALETVTVPANWGLVTMTVTSAAGGTLHFTVTNGSKNVPHTTDNAPVTSSGLLGASLDQIDVYSDDALSPLVFSSSITGGSPPTIKPSIIVDANAPLDAGIVGVLLPQDPGTATWAFKTPTGVTPDTLTAGQRAIIEAQNGNYFTKDTGASISYPGTMAGDSSPGTPLFIDLVQGAYALESDLQTALMAVLTASKKIPYTDAGVSQVLAAATKTEAKYVGTGFLEQKAPADTYIVPLVAVANPTDKSNRIFRGFQANYQTSGGIQVIADFAVKLAA